MKLFPYIAAFIGGIIGWKLGELVHTLVGALLSFIGGALAFYYARKYQKEMLG